MTDLRQTIAPKSDQLNADDLIGSTKTIKVTKVSLCAEAEQPIAINFEGDDGKPYKPCKSMRRVLVSIWGPDGNAYAGRSMTLYRDDKVLFGGVAVGGIRISHMTNITSPVTMALTATRANRKPFTVQPLREADPPATPAPTPEPPPVRKGRTLSEAIGELETEFAAAETRDQVDEVLASDKCQKALDFARNDAKERLDGIIRAAMAKTAAPVDNAPEHGAAPVWDAGKDITDEIPF